MRPAVAKAPKMATATIGTSLPKIAPPSTPIHMANIPVAKVSSRAPTILVESSQSIRNKSAPATIVKSNTELKTILTSTDYGSFATRADTGRYGVYPPFVTERQTGYKIPPRVNPLKPAPPERLTTMLETTEPHWHNEKRSNIMKQREWYRYHGTWSKAFYGSPAEKEAYR